MAAVLDTTVGGASANSYASIAAADAYHDTHPYADVWTEASADAKTRTLITATRLIDTLMEFDGTVVSSTQRLLWPRIGVIGPGGYEYPSTSIPERLVFATAELARQLLVSDRTADSDLETQGITGLTAGPVSLTFSGTARAKVLPSAVSQLLRALGRNISADISVPTVRT